MLITESWSSIDLFSIWFLWYSPWSPLEFLPFCPRTIKLFFIFSMIYGIITFLSWFGSILDCYMCSLLSKSLNLFLIWDSVLPSIILAISLHLFPKSIQSSRNSMSSFMLHCDLLIDGSRDVIHLSLHCFPFL